MKNAFTDLCEYLDYNYFYHSSNEELKDSLQKLCDYFSKTQKRRKIKLEYADASGFNENQSWAEADVDKIILNPQGSLTDYNTYLKMFDCVIHESFHQFQNYLINIPKSLLDEVMWKRIFSYNVYYFLNEKYTSNEFDEYFVYLFNSYEMDAYNSTTLILSSIYFNLKKRGRNVEKLKEYIQEETKKIQESKKVFLKKYGKNAKEKLDKFLVNQAIERVREEENFVGINEEIHKKLFNGEYFPNIFDGNEICKISNAFLANFEENFKTLMFYLYNDRTNSSQNNEK